MNNCECRTRCPGGLYCGCTKCNDRSEFQKLLELKEGVDIYRHNRHQNESDDVIEVAMPEPSYPRPFATENTFAAKKISADDNIVLIVNNTEDKKAIAVDFLHDFDLNKINCPRCREILKRAKAMLVTISAVQNRETIGMCELCRIKERFRGPCQHCLKSIEKFKSIKLLMARKEDHLKNQLDSLLRRKVTNVNKMKEHEKRRSYSDIDIQNTLRQKTRQSFDHSLVRPKSGMIVYSKVKSMHDKKCACFLQKQIETNKFIADFKTQVDLKKAAPGRVKEDYYLEEKISKSLPLLKFAEQQAPQLLKKTPGHSGLKSETVLGIGTTGVMRRSHSDESLLTPLSDFTKEMFKKNFKYFFPGGIKKKETIVKTSEELISDLRDRFQAETDEKSKKEEQQMLDKLEKQREKETAIEKIKLKTERARRERMSDIDINAGNIIQRIKKEGIEMEKRDSFTTKQDERRGIVTKKKSDKKSHEPIEKENMIQSVKEKVRLGKQREQKEQITSVERRPMLDKDRKHIEIEKGNKKIKESKTMKGERKVKEEVKKLDMIKEERKEIQEKVKKISKKPDTVKKELKPNEKEDRVDKVKEEKKLPVKVEKASKPPDTVNTESKRKEKEERKEKEKQANAEKITKPSDKVKTERKPKEKEERKEKEKPVNVGKITKIPETVKTDQKPKEKEKETGKIKQEQHEIGKSDRTSKVRKETDTLKEGKKSKEREEMKDAEKPSQKAKEINKKGQEPIDHGSKVKSEEKVKKEIGKDRDIKLPVRATPNAVEPKNLDVRDKAKKEEKRGEKSEKVEKVEKIEKRSKGVTPNTDEKLLDATLMKEEKMKLDAMKAKELSDAKHFKDMQKADALLANKSVEPKDLNVRDKAKKEEKGGEKGEKGGKGEKVENGEKGKKGEKGEKIGAEKPSKKNDELDFKYIKYEPSGDDLILRLVRTSRPKDIKPTPTLEPLPLSLKIIRRKRKRRSSLIVRLESDSDAESILQKNKKVVKKEIVYGEKICLEKDIPQEPERAKAAIFETAFEDQRSFEPGTGKSELEPLLEPDKHDGKGSFRYKLSDRKFIDKGWTVLPTQKVFRKLNMYRMHPAKPEFDWFERNKGKGPMTYDSGEKLAEVTSDGRGKWYYKNGKIALDYYESEDVNAQRVVVYSSGEPDERGRSRPVTVLGMFDHLGSGVVFDHHGKIRLKYNQNEGVVLDRELGPVTHWLWHSLNEPPELEQVMIDTQLPYKDPEIDKLGDDEKVRSIDEKMVAIELDNLVRSRIAKSTQKFIPHEIRMKALKINSQFSLKVIDQKTIHLLFREGLITMKLNLGMKLDDTEILDTRKSELNDVSVDIEKKPAMNDSLANLQKSLNTVKRLHQVRVKQELRARPVLPAASADRMTAAISKPLRVSLLASSEPSKYPNCRAANVYYNTRLI